MMENNLSFWGRVQEAIGRSGLSASEIARRGEFHRQNLSTRSGMMTIDTLCKFCKVTNTSADWLLGLGVRNEQIH